MALELADGAAVRRRRVVLKVAALEQEWIVTKLLARPHGASDARLVVRKDRVDKDAERALEHHGATVASDALALHRVRVERRVVHRDAA